MDAALINKNSTFHKCLIWKYLGIQLPSIKLFFIIFFLWYLTASYSFSTRLKQTEISVLFTPKISIPVLCWRIRGTSFQHSGGPSGPTATSPCALYLARSLEVSEISTRFHVTEILPAITPPSLLSPAFCLPSQVL